MASVDAERLPRWRSHKRSLTEHDRVTTRITETSARSSPPLVQLAAIDGSDRGHFVNPFGPLDSEYYNECFYPAEETLFRALKALDDVDFIPDPGDELAADG